MPGAVVAPDVAPPVVVAVRDRHDGRGVGLLLHVETPLGTKRKVDSPVLGIDCELYEHKILLY